MDVEPIRIKEEEFEPGKRKLDRMSVEDLQAYIADMKVEIARVEAAVDAKESFRAKAESVFKS